MPPNGCIIVDGDFSPDDFSGEDFDTGSLECGPYFTQAQQVYDPVQAQQVVEET
jgi:hypothetical protein